MTELDDIYNMKILEFAADIPRSKRLDHADATAEAQSKLCGSTIEIDLKVADERITDFGQTVKACLLGQAAAAIVGREIVGTSIDEFSETHAQMKAMLRQGAAAPDGRWADLGTLAPVKDYPHRQASVLLVFEAISKALQKLGAVNPSETAAVEPTVATRAEG
jgi:NifU-like protein involved in Fe-S cluster formation